MRIEERHMAPGQADLTLTEDAPGSLLDLLTLSSASGPPGYSTVIVTDAEIPADAVEALLVEPFETSSDPSTIPPEDPNPLPDGLPLPRWSGVLTGVSPGGRQLKMSGLLGWFGDDRRGQLVDAWRYFPVDSTFPTGIVPTIMWHYLLDGAFIGTEGFEIPPSPLKARYFLDASWPTQFFGQLGGRRLTRKSLLDAMVAAFDMEYVVRPHGWVDAGDPARLFPPAQLVTVMGETGGRDFGVQSLASTIGTELDLSAHLDELIITAGTDESETLAQSSPRYRDMFGRLVTFGAVDAHTELPSAMLGAVASQDLAASQGRREITVSSATHEGLADVQVGQLVDVFDPAQWLSDPNNPVTVHGRVVYPVRLKALAMKWSPQPGQGVYLRYWNGTDHTIEPLHRWIEWADPSPVEFEVDWPRQRLIAPVPSGIQTAEQVEAWDYTGVGPTEEIAP